MQNADISRETPGAVVGAVAAGCAPLPFLGVYAVLFIVHGGFHPVVPPDITDSAGGELVAGIIALVIFLISVVTLFWLLNGRRRWPFVLVQLAGLATTIDFALDATKGGRTVSVALAVAAVVALVCAFLPASGEWVGSARLPWPSRRPAAADPATAAEPATPPELAEPESSVRP